MKNLPKVNVQTNWRQLRIRLLVIYKKNVYSESIILKLTFYLLTIYAIVSPLKLNNCTKGEG